MLGTIRSVKYYIIIIWLASFLIHTLHNTGHEEITCVPHREMLVVELDSYIRTCRSLCITRKCQHITLMLTYTDAIFHLCIERYNTIRRSRRVYIFS